MKYQFELVSLRNQKIIKQYDAYIELLPDRINYKVEFSALEPVNQEDKSIGEEKVMSFFETTARLTAISGVELDYIQATKKNKNIDSLWCISISLSGMQNDIKIYFEEDRKAKTLRDTIVNHIF